MQSVLHVMQSVLLRDNHGWSFGGRISLSSLQGSHFSTGKSNKWPSHLFKSFPKVIWPRLWISLNPLFQPILFTVLKLVIDYFVYLRAYQPLIGYVITNFDSFVNLIAIITIHSSFHGNRFFKSTLTIMIICWYIYMVSSIPIKHKNFKQSRYSWRNGYRRRNRLGDPTRRKLYFIKREQAWKRYVSDYSLSSFG